MSLVADKTHNAIMNLAAQREERRRQAEELKKRRASEARELQERGKFGDSDFVSMIERFRAGSALVRNPRSYIPGEGKINVAVRKRPCSDREVANQDHDSVTCSNPFVVVHHCKLKVDGITKLLENTQFEFDYAFNEIATNDEVYNATCLPLVQFVALQDGRSTVFAYGQTGSGKTFTMQGLQERAARDIFRFARTRASKDTFIRVKCANFELYGSQCLDLLNDRRVCAVREDGQGEIHIDGLREEEAADEDDFLSILQRGMTLRTSRCTEMNADSSRSHAIFQVSLSTGGKLSLIDLAGSERGQDSKNHDQTRRVESAHINKSLLALKECIRALDPGSGATHVPYRGSKLTMVLKDSFAEHSKTVMISCVSPAASSSDHTLNTLRYADRVKAKGGQHKEQTSTAVMSAKSPGPVRKSLAPSARSSTIPTQATRTKSPTSLPSTANSSSIPAPPAIISTQPMATMQATARPVISQSQSLGFGKFQRPVQAQHQPQQQQQQQQQQQPQQPLQNAQDNNKRQRYPMSPRTSALTMNLSGVSLNKGGANLDQSGISTGDRSVVNGALYDQMMTDDDSFVSNRLDLDEDDDERQGDEEENYLPLKKKDQSLPAITSVAPTAWGKKQQQLAAPPPPGQKLTPQQVHQPARQLYSQLHHSVTGGGTAPPAVTVYALVDQEEVFFKTYTEAVQYNFRILTEESKLLSEVDSAVDYDVDDVVERLRGLLEDRLQRFSDLHSRLLLFQNNLRQEEESTLETLM